MEMLKWMQTSDAGKISRDAQAKAWKDEITDLVLVNENKITRQDKKNS